MKDVIELININKYYGQGENQVHVLKDVNLRITKGDFVAIMGQSGSGKSTLMNILGCLDRQTSGTYKIDNVDTFKMDSNALAMLRGKKLGFIFQRYNLMSGLSACDNVALPAVYIGLNSKDRKEKAKVLLEEFGLGDKLHNKPSELSGGQQQRVSIARALVNGGEIILADEPTGALDSQSGVNVMKILKDLNAKGHTIIVVTHDAQIANYAHRVIEIKDGVIWADNRRLELENVPQLPLEVVNKNFWAFQRNQFIESFKMSIQAIFVHKMRSLLTMLGIIIGIASVISVVALGRGSQEKILADISRMGTNTIDIRPGKGFHDRTSATIKTLVPADANILAQQPYIESTSPMSTTGGTIIYKNLSSPAQLFGVGEQYADVKGLEIAQGRFFNPEEVLGGEPVLVIDQNTVDEFFPEGLNPLGEVFLINRQPLLIIGVTKKSPTDTSDNLRLYTPYTVVMSRITGAKNISAITVKVADDVPPVMAEQNLTELLTMRHGGVKDFFTINFDSIRETIQGATDTMTLLISGIALISLIVGGIGVMNIMLVSVTERTKEIGIRMAIGAKQYNVLQQFLIEAVLICLIGGVVGITLAYGAGFAMLQLVPDFPMIFSTQSVILAISCSTIIGIVFGFMPARNASMLNPVDALARE